MRSILGLLVTLALFGFLVSRELLAASMVGRPRGEPILIGALVGTATDTWLLSPLNKEVGVLLTALGRARGCHLGTHR
jgi:hypothetical protein